MSIVIVSAPPASAPLASVLPLQANVPAEADGSDLTQDFTSLLLEQLAVAWPGVEPGAESSPGAAPRFTGDPGHEKPADDEDAEAGDLLAALAVLAFFAPEDKAAVVVKDGASSDPAGTAVSAPFGEAGAANQGKLAASPLPAPASEPAAKFAALVDGMTVEDAAQVHEPALPHHNVLEPLVVEDAAQVREPAPVPPPPVAGAVATDVHVDREAAPPAIPIPTPLHSGDWSRDFTQTVTWVATQRYQSADLTLNPPALGSIEISLKFDSDRSTATAFFVSGSAEVREIIETALPKLREMLAGAGIELGQANVGAESFRQATAGNGQGAREDASPSGNELAILEPDPRAGRLAASLSGAGRGLVDMFV